MDIESLIKTIKEMKYMDRIAKREFNVLYAENAELVEREIRNWAVKQPGEIKRKELEIKVGQLEAKCLAYEAIIKNSNFAPVIAAVSKDHEEVQEECY